ncbi:hypothetical protein [Paraburkholderia aspalathi]|uniref:hypothetical protein n=1 Tax=Paraburkholderia aspalathi TaxID=1324617 RepID=UPI003C828AD3
MKPDNNIHIAPVERATSRGVIAGVVASFALFIAFIFVLPLAPRMPTVGLDPSWCYALNEAVVRHLVFGRDLIFTFGPLGSVYTVMYHPGTDGIMLVGSAVLALALCFGFALLAGPNKRLLLVFLPLIIVESRIRDAIFMAVPLVLLFAAFVESGSRSENRPWRIGMLLFVSAAAGILPLVKGSFAALSAAMVVLAAVLFARRHKFRISILLCSTSGAALILSWVLTGQPLAALPNFFLAQEPIISGYTEAMSIHGPYSSVVLWAVPAGICLFAFIAGFWRQRGIDCAIVSFGLALFLFITFKAGYVRQDGHPGITVASLLFVGLALSMLSHPLIAVLIAVSVFVGWFKVENQLDGFNFRYMADVAYHSFDATKAGIAQRSDPSLLPRMFEDAKQRIRTEVPLPKMTGSVDVYPTELSVVFANDLKWSGRPVPQSYSVYKPELDRLNRNHLLAPDAPDHVLFAVGPIDNRLPALEDAGSWPVLISHYRVADSIGGFVNLERAVKPTDSRLVPLSSSDATPNTVIDVPQGPQVIWAKIDLRPTLAGRIAMTLFKLPQVYIDLVLDDGSVVHRRFIPAMALNGFVLSPYVSTTNDFAKLMDGKPLPRVVRFSIVAPRVGLWNESMTTSFAALSQ